MFKHKIIMTYASVWTHVLGTQKNGLIMTVLLSTHNLPVCFIRELRKSIQNYPLLSGACNLCQISTGDLVMNHHRYDWQTKT